MIDRLRPNRLWQNAYEAAARHPWLGTAVGLALVAVFIPILRFAGGYYGSFGPSIPLFFLVPTLLASALGGRVSGVIVSFVALAVWDWFFIPPFYRPTIYYPRDLLALVIFLFVALLTGQLATVTRRRVEDAVRRARTTEALYDLSVALIGSRNLETALSILTERLRATFDLQASVILLRDPGGRAWHAVASSGSVPEDLDIGRSRTIAGVLSYVESTGQMCGLDGSQSKPGDGLPVERGLQAQFWPLRVGTRLVGVLELVYGPHAQLDTERDRLLATLVNGAALALEQERLQREEQEAELARESDRLKSALLSSVSHDLRTPLAGIKAAASSLLQRDVRWSDQDSDAFLTDIDAEADRLARLVSNLLDLSRIEAGALKPNLEWEDLGELAERVARRLKPQLGDHPVVVDVEPDLPQSRFDAVHIEQVLANLVENAAKYSATGAPIDIAVTTRLTREGKRELCLTVSDRGAGIPPEERRRIFDKFYRVASSNGWAGGTGMGLAIVKGLVEANGGRVSVEARSGGGSTFEVSLPVSDSSRQTTRHSADDQPTVEGRQAP